MAKLKDHKFYMRSATDEELRFTSVVTVDKEGCFHLSIPDELEDVARAMLKGMASYTLTRPRQSLRLSGTDLDACENFIKRIMDEYLACDVKEELVIVYGALMKVGYAKSRDDDTIGPNGYSVSKTNCADPRDFDWCGDLHASNRSEFYTVGVAAEVRKKITYTRASVVKHEYKWPDYPNNHGVSDHPGERLNSFTSITVNPKKLKEMPYTDAAALFFYEMMLGMCHLADRFEMFFSDEDAIKHAIDHGVGPLSLPAQTKGE